MVLISIIVPCYRNAENIAPTFERLTAMVRHLPEGTSVEHIFVDDGSGDGTFAALSDLQQTHPSHVIAIKLARNVGPHNACLAGMRYAKGACITVIPADLQEPPELIPRMFDHWRKGIKLVLANRDEREEGIGSRSLSAVFHWLMKTLAFRKVPKGGFGWALFDRAVMDELLAMSEKNTNTLFLLAWMGYDHVVVPYTRTKRGIGRSGWTLSKKIKLFIDSFVAFSFFPIRAITLGGLILAVLALGYAGLLLYASLSGRIAVKGWSALMLVLLVVSSFQMIALGILGEYLWRTLDAARRRPAYFLDEVLDKRS